MLLECINRIYSFIHIPGTITFLAWLYHYAPASLFEARRRTLAICNLMAFVVFTAWPCMPPRLLPEEDGFGFIDTVHKGKVASVWTTNKFCNQLGKIPFHTFMNILYFCFQDFGSGFSGLRQKLWNKFLEAQAKPP